MSTLRAIREIVVQYRSEGAEEAKRSQEEFAKSSERVEKATSGVAVVTEKASRSQVQAAGGYEKVRAQLDLNFRAQQQFASAQRTIDRAFQQGVIDQRAYSDALEMARQRKVAATVANDNFSRSLMQTDGAVGNVYRSVRNLVGIYASFATLRTLGGLGDQWSELQSRVTNATGSIQEGRETLQRLAEMSARTYSSIQQTTSGWLDQKLALDELGYSTSAQLDLIETLNNSLVISATRGDRAQSVMKAWSDAMATGKLQTEGLNTILTGSPRLATALADSLDVSVASLRTMATQGQLTSDKLFGVTSQLEAVRKEADAMDATIADGWVRIQNSLLQFVGAADQAGGSTSALAQELVKISDWMDANGQLAVVIGDDIARSIEMARSLANDATAAYGYLNSAAAEVHDSVNEFIRLIGLAGNESESFGSAWFDTMADVRGYFAETALDAVARVSAIPSAGKAAYDTFVDGWSQFPGAIGGIVVEGAARVIETVEGMVDRVIGILNYIPTIDINPVGSELSAGFRDRFGRAGDAAGGEFVDAFWSNFDANQARVSAGVSGLVSGIGDALGYETREVRQVREAVDAISTAAADAWAATKEWLYGTTSEAPAAGSAIRTGVVAAAQDAEKALREAEAARRALMGEADAAVRRFFPFETAVADAQRLLAIVDDNTNGLSRMQREALQLQANQAFVDLADKAKTADGAFGRLNGSLETQRDLFSNVASSLLDAFDAGSAEDFFGAVTKGLADLGDQFSNDISELMIEEAA